MSSSVSNQKLRLAWFSELNLTGRRMDHPSVSAYFSDLVLGGIAERFEIELFHRQAGSSFAAGGLELPVSNYLTAVSRHQAAPFDIFFYQVEDRREASFARLHLGLMPGIVLLHDYVFNTPRPEPFLDSPWCETAQLYHNGRQDWPRRDKQRREHAELGLREGGLAVLPLFSSVWAHSFFRKSAECQISLRTDCQSSYLPIPVESPVVESTVVESTVHGKTPRQEMSGRVVLFCGNPDTSARVHKLFQALSGFEEISLIWLVDAEGEAAAKRLIVEFSLKNVHLILGRTPARFGGYLPDIDAVVLALAGDTGRVSPYLEMSLMSGKATIVSDTDRFDDLPDAVVYKVPPGEHEAREFGAVLTRVFADPFALSPSAMEFARETFDSRAVCGQLADLLWQSAACLKEFNRSWSGFEAQAKAALLAETNRSPDLGDAELTERCSPGGLYRTIRTELGWL